MNYVSLDFEYYASSERDLNVVCVAMSQEDPLGAQETETFWLHDDPQARSAFAQRVADLAHEGAVFVAYNAIAEGRALLSLGVDPTQLTWVDLMLEWKQLGNENHARMYGPMVVKGKTRTSTPPPTDELGRVIKKPKGSKSKAYHAVVPYNLVNAVYNMLEILISSEHKDKMRDRILKGGPFNDTDKAAILEYCASDIIYLPTLREKMESEIRALSSQSKKEYHQAANLRGEWAVRLAKMEQAGIPVNVERLSRMADNYAGIRHEAIKHLVETVYPFYLWEGKDWVEKRNLFADFVKSKGLEDSWPRTEAGQFSTAKATLEENEHIREIKEYRRCRELIGQIKSFKKGTKGTTWQEVGKSFDDDDDASPSTEGKENIFHRIGTDRRLRCYFNPYGTQTSRNAPPATNFIFAMSAWIRSCIEAPPGKAITGIDFSSQEVLIAGLISGDANLVAAYDSGDVYLHFGKLAGAIPPNGTKKTHKEERDLFKSTVLGMQFQMGKRKLHRKLISDTGKDDLSEETAFGLYALHKDTFSTYWAWVDETVSRYGMGIPLSLPDGWFLFTDNPNPRSAGNFPIQGGGGVVLRRAVRYAQEAGLEVVATLHDAIYIVHDEDDTESPKVLEQCMQRAFTETFNHPVRMEAKTIKHGDFFLEEKGVEYFRKLMPYFLTPDEQEWYWLSQGYDERELAKMEK